MKKFLLCFLLIPISVFGQDDYNKILKKAINVIEKNYSGFEEKKDVNNRFYSYLKSELTQDSIKNKDSLIVKLNEYISFFQDSHLNLYEFDPTEYLNETNYEQDDFSFKVLTPNTTCLKIPNLFYKKLVDSLVDVSLDVILSKRDLIIDVRGCSGGGDAAFTNLLPLLSTNNILIRNSEFLATKGNWNFFQTMIELPNWDNSLDGKFIDLPWIDSTYTDGKFCLEYKFKKLHTYPKHVAILIDNEVGSAGEQFVFSAKQSLKVKLFGENTGGIIDYSNCRQIVLIPDEMYLWVPTTRIKGLPKNRVDKHGIAPDYYLKDENQIEQILLIFDHWNKIGI